MTLGSEGGREGANLRNRRNEEREKNSFKKSFVANYSDDERAEDRDGDDGERRQARQYARIVLALGSRDHRESVRRSWAILAKACSSFPSPQPHRHGINERPSLRKKLVAWLKVA